MTNHPHGAAPPDDEREPGTREDGEAMPPAAIDPGAHDNTGSQPPPAQDDGGKSASTDQTNSPEGDELGPDAAKMVKDATGF